VVEENNKSREVAESSTHWPHWLRFERFSWLDLVVFGVLKALPCHFVWPVEKLSLAETGLGQPLAGGLGYLYSFLALPFLSQSIGSGHVRLSEYSVQLSRGHPSLLLLHLHIWWGRSFTIGSNRHLPPPRSRKQSFDCCLGSNSQQHLRTAN
jgi:hypothetical protein